MNQYRRAEFKTIAPADRSAHELSVLTRHLEMVCHPSTPWRPRTDSRQTLPRPQECRKGTQL
jgi:hypothetical protein